MNAITRARTAAAMTAFLAMRTGGVGTAFAEDAPTAVNADQDGNPIPQAPDDADAVVNVPAHPDGCPPDPTVSITKVKSTFVGDKSEWVSGQSGVMLSLSVAKGHTCTGTISYAAKLSESIIVESAEETISGSISYAKTTTVTLGGSWKVPANQRDGWLALGSKGYSFNWERGSYNGGCKWIVSNHGTANSRHSRPTSPTRELRTI